MHFRNCVSHHREALWLVQALLGRNSHKSIFQCIFRGHWLDMSGGRLPNRPSSCYSSTPVKTSQKQAFPTSQRLDSDVLSDDEERFSLLSPIYSGSSDSDEDLEPSDAHISSPFRSNTSSVSPVRCCLCLLFSINQPRNSVRADFIEQPVIFVADVSYRGDHMIK